MTDKELFIETITNETKAFVAVVRAIPEINQDYRPDPKSKTAIELAATIAAEMGCLNDFLTKGEYDFATMQKPLDKNSSEIAEILAHNLETVKNTATSMTSEEWIKEARMLANGKEAGWKMGRGRMVFSLLLDLIHHRGQLTTYLRAMGGKVPPIYGPSADSV